MSRIHLALAPFVGVLIALGCTQPTPQGAEPQGTRDGQRFVVDPFWPKPLKDNWIVGQIAGLHVDTRDHLWILHRPNTLLADEKVAKPDQATRCCVAAPAVMEFDPQGVFVRGERAPSD